MSEILTSWNEGTTKQAIIDFVALVTDADSTDYVMPDERIAVFDNDGTLWCEQPAPVQGYFMKDRLHAMAPDNPDWETTEPFKSMLAGDMKGVLASGIKGIAEIGMVTHAGMTTDDFASTVREWLAKAKHPKLDRPYTEVIYQPMLEVLDFLRSNDFTTFIVSGGGAEFMRVFAEDVYGVPPRQVIGSTIKTHFEMQDDTPVLIRDPELDFFDDKAGKPVNINKYIGQRPIACFGNSDGDREMLMWTTLGRTDRLPSLGVIVHHTDAIREFAYDRDQVISGRLDKGLDEADECGWVLVDMKLDWKVVFPTTTGKARSAG